MIPCAFSCCCFFSCALGALRRPAPAFRLQKTLGLMKLPHRPQLRLPPAEALVTAQSVLPSATPFVYTIKAGDTLGQVAQKFNVKLDALLAANPDVDPNGMTVGKTLNIPGDQKDPTGASTPTPVPFALEETNCHRMTDGGLWCFAQARNNSPDISGKCDRPDYITKFRRPVCGKPDGFASAEYLAASCQVAAERLLCARLPI